MSPHRGGTRFIHADDLIGRSVVDDRGEPAGRIQELRVEKRGSEWLIVAYVLGLGGLLERLNVAVRLMVGGRLRTRVATFEQMDLTDPRAPRLNCSREALRNE